MDHKADPGIKSDPPTFPSTPSYKLGQNMNLRKSEHF